MGMARNANDRQTILMPIATTVPTLGHTFVKPSVNFKRVAQTISKRPATNNKVHAISSRSFT
jgi:hypothetical protein